VIKNVQVLRALAALMVICVHLRGLLGTLGLPVFGGGGVDLFFVISGFIMVFTTRIRAPTAIEFFTNRITRVAPIYWVMTLATFTATGLAPFLIRDLSDYSVVNLVKSLFFIPYEKSNGLVQPILFVGWTLNYEMFFYVLFSVGLAMRHYTAGLAGIVAILSSLVLIGLLPHAPDILLDFYTRPIILEFALGMGVGLLVDHLPSQPTAKSRVFAFGSLAFLPVIILAPLAWPGISSFFTAGLPAMLVLTGAVLFERWGKSVSPVSIVGVGNASYALYLIHPIFTAVAEKIGDILHVSGILTVLLILLTFASIVFASLIMHKTIERPLFRLARDMFSVKPFRIQSA